MSEQNLNVLTNHTQLKPITFFNCLAAEIRDNQKYYIEFDTVSDLLKAVKQKVVDGRVWDKKKQKWVPAPQEDI